MFLDLIHLSERWTVLINNDHIISNKAKKSEQMFFYIARDFNDTHAIKNCLNLNRHYSPKAEKVEIWYY